LKFNILREPAPVLVLQGHLLDTIARISDFDYENDPFGVLNFISKIPHLYQEDIFSCVDGIVGSSPEPPFSLKIEEGNLISVGYIRGRSHSVAEYTNANRY
jgi:hypothetical protein